MKKIYYKIEFILILVIIFMITLIGIINPAALNANSVFNMCRSIIVVGIFAVGVLMVLLSGGVDVSFTYIAPVAAYLAVKILTAVQYTGSVLLPFLLAALFGMLMGAVNGFLISKFKFPTLIVTLGTGTAFQGLTVFLIGAVHITNLPGQMIELSKKNLITFQNNNNMKGGLNITILITAAVIILGWFLLKKTMWGRGLYAIGGSVTSAERVGYNVKLIQFTLYMLVGGLSGIAGIIFMSLNRQATPHLMVGTELDVIAAVVLGGASVFGGKGSILGTVLGVVLVTILNNSLILIGIPTEWQKAVIGIVIIIGTMLPILLGKVNKKQAVSG